MKIIVTTSNNYLHILPVFCYLFNLYWGQKPVEVVGFDVPKKKLPENFKFISLGKQAGKNDFSTQLAHYFRQQDKWFIWMMEDTFLVDQVKKDYLQVLQSLCADEVGRINLSHEAVKQDHVLHRNIQGFRVFENTPTASYRLSTQPSIWNKDFLLRYLTPGLSPWEFETQPTADDGYKILGPGACHAAILHNEGVRRHDLHKFNFTGLPVDVIAHLNKLIA